VHQTRETQQECGKRITQEFERKLANLDTCSVHGEYTIWIYKQYLLPSFLSFFAVNPVTESTIKKLQVLALRKIKKWLNLPRSFTASALYHPGAIDIPELSALKTKDKLTLLASISTSQDPLIEEISGYFTNKSFL